jgi:hypothetical protein
MNRKHVLPNSILIILEYISSYKGRFGDWDMAK